MNRSLDAELVRWLAGELPPDRARELAGRLAREPELAARHRALSATWTELAPPPPSPVPVGLAARVMGQVRGSMAPGALSWTLAPTWVRAAAAFALAVGVALGAGLGHRSAPPAELPPGMGISPPESLATTYWTAVEDATAAPSRTAGARP